MSDDALEDELDRLAALLVDEGPEVAWPAVERALRSAPDGAPFASLGAVALLELGEPEHARRLLAAHPADPPDADRLEAEAEVALALWETDRARAAYDALVDADGETVHRLHRLALLADLADDARVADRHLARAAAVDPEAGALGPSLSASAFDRVLRGAIAELPAEFQAALDAIPLIVDPVPHRDLAAADPAGTPPDLLGLFVGRSALERSVEESGEPPAAIYLFRRNLERTCATRAELEEQIAITLYHELGHALGFDEEGVDDLGLA